MKHNRKTKLSAEAWDLLFEIQDTPFHSCIFDNEVSIKMNAVYVENVMVAEIRSNETAELLWHECLYQNGGAM